MFVSDDTTKANVYLILFFIRRTDRIAGEDGKKHS